MKNLMFGMTVACFAMLLAVNSSYANNRILVLDGDYASVFDSASLDVNNTMTISAWINFDQLPSEAGSVYRIVTKDDVGVSRAFAFGISSGDKLYFEYLSDNTTLTDAEANDAFMSGDAGTWKHVAITVIASSKTVRLYIDGVLVDSIQHYSNSSSIQNSTADLLIGARKNNGTPQLFFEGKIDEVSIWNKALTQEEIQATMNEKLQGDEQSLVGYWNFDSGTADDLSPFANHGTLMGDAKIIPPINRALSFLYGAREYVGIPDDSTGSNQIGVIWHPKRD